MSDGQMQNAASPEQEVIAAELDTQQSPTNGPRSKGQLESPTDVRTYHIGSLVSALPYPVVTCSNDAGELNSAIGTQEAFPKSKSDWPEVAICRGIASDVVKLPRWKRALDLFCILISLPVWLSVMILISVWISIVSPGPILYRQVRVGYRGRRFRILKFRSMRVNVETRTHERYFASLIKTDRPMQKLDTGGDPRLIPGGRILRALGLDELPQIVNVMRGEMSLVGPRPCTPQEFNHYDEWHKQRVNAPPGLTGFWQVNGKNRTTFREMIQMDLFYANHMSLGLDLTIISRTIPAIVGQVADSWRQRRRSGQPCINS